jgi:hypothetical protein
VLRQQLLTGPARQFCTPEIWEQYKDTKSSGPAKWTMARAINSGVSYPSSFVGCHAGDAESYDEFKDFFYPVVQVTAVTTILVCESLRNASQWQSTAVY